MLYYNITNSSRKIDSNKSIFLLWVYNWGLHWGYSELTIETENAIRINNIRVLTL